MLKKHHDECPQKQYNKDQQNKKDIGLRAADRFKHHNGNSVCDLLEYLFSGEIIMQNCTGRVWR
jgi:hypothetical protein